MFSTGTFWNLKSLTDNLAGLESFLVNDTNLPATTQHGEGGGLFWPTQSAEIGILCECRAVTVLKLSVCLLRNVPEKVLAGRPICKYPFDGRGRAAPLFDCQRQLTTAFSPNATHVQHTDSPSPRVVQNHD